MEREIGELKQPHRILLGPGPSTLDYRVLRAMTTPVVGYMDPTFLHVMDETTELLRYVFKTENEKTLVLSGSGTAGMEASLMNLIQKGDRVLVGVAGYFSQRISEIVKRCGGELITVEAPWGQIIEPGEMKEALDKYEPPVVFMVHGETSTGIEQPLAEIGAMVRERDGIFGVDSVASLGGVPVETDEWNIDIIYSGSQKCLGAPPGVAPVSINERAWQKISSRAAIPSFYLDLNLIWKYWGSERVYHHTPPMSLIYGLREALRIIEEEGLEGRFKRHEINSQALLAGLGAMGFSPFAQEGYGLVTLNAIEVPEDIDEGTVRKRLLDEYNIEIVGGLGPLAGKIWRIGLMGTSSTRNNVLTILAALENILTDMDKPPAASGVSAAVEVYRKKAR